MDLKSLKIWKVDPQSFQNFSKVPSEVIFLENFEKNSYAMASEKCFEEMKLQASWNFETYFVLTAFRDFELKFQISAHNWSNLKIEQKCDRKNKKIKYFLYFPFFLTERVIFKNELIQNSKNYSLYRCRIVHESTMDLKNENIPVFIITVTKF